MPVPGQISMRKHYVFYLSGRSSVHPFVYSFIQGQGKGLDTCYSATYMSQTRDQQRFTISEVAANWHEPIVPLPPANRQVDPRFS